MHLRRVLVAALAAGGLIVGLAPAPFAYGQGAPSCDEDSWIAGSVDVCDGAIVYRDYVFDDYGADTGDATAPTTGSLSRPAGDVRYPEGAEATADLVRLELRAVGDELQVTALLNALYEPDSTILALAIDTDDDPTTGGGPWEGLQDVTSEGWDEYATFDTGDPATNTIRGSLPLPVGERWRVQAATAQADGTVMNVAFRGTDEVTATGAWFEDLQASALSTLPNGGGGDVSAFAQTVEAADLRAGVTKPAPLVAGFHSRVYRSRYTLPPGEGMSYTPQYGRHGQTTQVCEQAFHFFGPYQPYGIYIPEGDGAKGLQLALHGCNANHSSLVDQPGIQTRFGDELDRIVVVPLGRGPIGYYSDISERDVLDVMADVVDTYDIDADRVFSGGYSMGGYGAYRMAALYPDRFAGAVAWVGFTGECSNNPATDDTGACSSGAVGNVIDLVRNLRHVPTAMIYAGADELVHVTSATAMGQAFVDDSAAPFRWWLHPATEHLTFAVVDDWRKEAAYTAGLRRVQAPARVTYRYDPSLAFPEYELRHDRAYWVSGIAAAAEGYADVDLTTAGCGGSVATGETGETAGADAPPLGAYVERLRDITGAEQIAQANALTGTLVNVAAIDVDVEAACLGPGELVYDLTTDAPATLRLSDGRAITIAGPGTHTGTLAPAGAQQQPVPTPTSPSPPTPNPTAPAPTATAAPSPAAPSPAPPVAAADVLPATGGSGILGVLALAAGAAGAVNRSRRAPTGGPTGRTPGRRPPRRTRPRRR